MANRNPNCVVSAILSTESGDLILQQRDDSPQGAAHLRGRVAFFGGHSEPGELPPETLLREVNEELEFALDPAYVAMIGLYQKNLALHGDNGQTYLYRYAKPISTARLTVREGLGLVLVSQRNACELPLSSFARMAVNYLLDRNNELERFRIA